MTICLTIQKWRHYLLGRHFIVRSDQQSLRYLMQQREVDVEYQKWVRKLLGFDFELQYKLGSANKVADALSRKTEGEVGLGAMVTTMGINWQGLEDDIKADLTL